MTATSIRRHRRERRASIELTPNSSPLNKRVSANAPTAPSAVPAIAKPQPGRPDQPDHVAALRAQRHPDPDLVRPLSHRIRDHSVNAQRRQQ